MWASFAMDRFNSSGTERPCIISESELGIQLPSHDKNLELNLPTITEQLDGNVRFLEPGRATENMGVGAYIVRVIALYGRVVKYVNQVSTIFFRFSFFFFSLHRQHPCWS